MSRFGNIFYKNFFLILLIYYALHIAIKVISGGVEYDDAEQFLLYQNISLIYDNAQPPLYNWLQYIFFKIFGLNIFAAALLKHLILFLTLTIYYYLALELKLSKQNALISTSALFLLPQFSWGLELKLTHSALLLLISALSYLTLLKFLNKPNNTKAILLGLTIGLGFLSKYSYLLLILSLLIASLLDKKYRNILFKYLPIIVVTIFLVTLIHTIPLLSNLHETISAISDKTYKNLGISHGFISLFKSTIVFLLPLLLFYFIAYIKLKPNKLELSKELKLIFKTIVIIYTIIALLILVGVFDDFKERWLLPYLFTIPILLFASFPKGSEASYKTLSALSISLVLALIVLIFFIRVEFPDFVYKIRGKYSHDLVQYSAIKSHIKSEPKYIDVNTLMLGGNIKLIFKNSCINCQHKADLTIKESNFKGAKEIKLPYINSKNYKSLYIKVH